MHFRDFLNDLNESYSSDMLKYDIIKKNSKVIADKFAHEDVSFQDLKFTQVATKSPIKIYDGYKFSTKFRNLVKKYSDVDTNVAVVALAEDGDLVIAEFGYYSPKEFAVWFDHIIDGHNDTKSEYLDKLWVATFTHKDKDDYRSTKGDRRENNDFVDPLIKKNEKFKEKLGASNSLSSFSKELKQMCMKAGADMSKFVCEFEQKGSGFQPLILISFTAGKNTDRPFTIKLRSDISVKDNEIDRNIFVIDLHDVSLGINELIQYGNEAVKIAKEAGKIKKFIEAHKYSDLL